MRDKHTKFAARLLSIRQTIRSLVTTMLTNAWPNPAAVVDFRIDSQKHYEAQYFPIREAEIMPKALSSATD